MAFVHPDGTKVPKYRIPYESYPTSRIEAITSDQVVEIDSTRRILEEVGVFLDCNKSIRLFFVGVFGAGKSFYLKLIGEQVISRRGLFLPIKFHKGRYFPTNDQTENYKIVLTNIVREIGQKLVDMEQVSKKDYEDIINRYPLTDFDEIIIQLFRRSTNNDRILLAFDELEVLFSSEGLNLRVSDVASFLHSLSESLRVKPNWGICASITPEWYREMLIEAPQLKRGRFEFKEIQPLKPSEIRFWIEAKNFLAIGNEYNKVYPFTEDVIKFLTVVSGGNPRALDHICFHVWSKAEPHFDVITEDIARKIFIVEFEPDAIRFFRNFRLDNSLSEGVEAFLLLMFLIGENEVSISELCSKKLSNTDISIPYLNTNSYSTLESRLRKAFAEIREQVDSEGVLADYILITPARGNAPFRFSLTNLLYSQIYEPSAE